MSMVKIIKIFWVDQNIFKLELSSDTLFLVSNRQEIKARCEVLNIKFCSSDSMTNSHE